MSTIRAQQRSVRPWIIAIVATVAIIAATLLGLRAFNTTAHAEVETPAQSAQSDSTTQSGSQSGDTPQSAEPTSISVPKPTPATPLRGWPNWRPSNITVVPRPVDICIQYRGHRRLHEGMSGRRLLR